jgi:hypothetical protein
MSSANLEKVIEEVKALTTDEQREVRKLLDELLNESASVSPEDLLEQRLLEAGLISRIPAKIADPSQYNEWEPVEVKGKPLSEMIIEDRR